MIYRFILLSGEQEDFLRELEMDGKQTFRDFHRAIQDNCSFDPKELASFFLCNEFWEKEQEISLIPFEEHTISDWMDASLESLITHKKQKLVYLFDFFGQRGFFIETIDIRPLKDGENSDFPFWIKQSGEPPLQFDEFTDDFAFLPEDEEDYDVDSDDPDTFYHDEDDLDSNF